MRPVANASGANTDVSVSVIATIAKPISRAPVIAACTARHAVLDVPEDVLQHDDRVVDDEADREHHRQQRQRVDREAERST